MFQSNYDHAGADGTGLIFMGMDGTNSRVSNSETNTIWFRRFIQCCHKRMGDLNLPDKAVDQYIIWGCFEIAQCLWEGNNFDPFAREKAAMAICIVLGGYYGGLQGGEIGKVDKGSMMKHWDKSIKHGNSPFVPLMLVGRSKRVSGEKMFCQPLAAETNDGRR